MLRQSNLALWLIGLIMTSAGHGGAQAGSIDRLTEHKWQRLVDYGASHPPDVTTWEFYKEGSFRKTFIADYTVRYVGAWSVSVIGQDRGVLFLSSLPRGAEAPRRYDALSFALKETELQLGEDWYRAIPLSAQEPVPGASQEEEMAVEPAHRAQFFMLWVTMATYEWRREGVATPGDADRYAFRRNGQYTARVESTQCEYSGTWSLFASTQTRGEIRLSVPPNRCDPRATADAFVREMPVELRDDRLFLYQTAYAAGPEVGIQ